MERMIGRIIGNYQITSELARGGMGTVYHGQHVHLPREVVVKSILLAPFSPSAQAPLKARFRREAYIQSQLDHPNIVRVYEFFTAEDNYFLVMEYVPGMSLRDLLARQGMPTPSQAVYLFKQALSALDYAHGFTYIDESDRRHTGVIHRDIKPANLLLDTKGRLKIADFGIAKVLGEQGATGQSVGQSVGMTQTGFHPGTVEYMSPEQIRGVEIDKRSDLYSLGVTFYEMLTGRLPFERSSSGSDWDVRKGHIELDPPPIHELRADVHPNLAAIVMRSLGKSPLDRYQNAQEFLEALKTFEQQHGANGATRAPNGKPTQQPLIVATTPDIETTRPARPSQASIENATTLAFEAFQQTPAQVQATIPNNPPPYAPPVFGAAQSPMAQGRLKLAAAAAGVVLLSASAGAYFLSRQKSVTEPSAVASQLEIPTPTPSATSTPPPKVAARPKFSSPPAGELTAFRQARAFEQQEQYGNAIKVFEEYLAQNPNASDTNAVVLRIGQLKQLQASLVSAEAAMNAAKYPLAARQFGDALRLNPDSRRAKEGLSQALAKMPDLPPNPMRNRPPRRAPNPNAKPEFQGPPPNLADPANPASPEKPPEPERSRRPGFTRKILRPTPTPKPPEPQP
jgi:serine/threonine-protein kinase